MSKLFEKCKYPFSQVDICLFEKLVYITKTRVATYGE